MVIISAAGISKSFGINEVLRDVNINLQSNDRIGVVGQNGSGKTTLMRILSGIEHPDNGIISVAKGTTIGYLAQQDMLIGEGTIWGELEAVYASVFQMEKKLRLLEVELSESHDNQFQFSKLSEEYDRLLNMYEESGGYSWKSMVTGVLNGLGFKQEQYDRSINSLSGGERTRLYLARLLLQKPDVLLLDEPTNHLDMESLSWLENYLTFYRGSVMVISHDRYFLDHVCNGIIEISSGTSEQYKGNYTHYIAQRTERYESRLRAYTLQQKEIERQEAIIARYRMYNREKSIKAAESREKALDRIEKLEKPASEKSIRFRFSAKRRTGEEVILVENLEKSFDNRTLFSHLNLRIRTGERWAIIGPNGIGKTTFIRILAGAEAPDHGSVSFGSNVDIGYYDQHQSTLHPNKTVIDEIWDRFPTMTQTDIRSVLGMFLFTGDDVFQTINTLSGGEKGRIALTALMLEKDNLLLLDEPTNHLDMESREVLEEALSDFPGTIITVSHDRYFINRIADHILEMTPNGITIYLGNYDDYLDKKNAPFESPSVVTKTKTMIDKERRKEKNNRQFVKKLKSDLDSIEKSIIDKENRIQFLEQCMADNTLYSNPQKVEEIQKEYALSKQDLLLLYTQWEEAESAFQNAEKQLKGE